MSDLSQGYSEGALADRVGALESEVARLRNDLQSHLARAQPTPDSTKSARRSQLDPADLHRLTDQMHVPTEARKYLEEHAFLIPLLPRVADKVRAYFGDGASIRLEVVTFPEAEDDRELFALVTSPLTPDDAHERLARFDEEWWVDAMTEADCKLSVDVAT